MFISTAVPPVPIQRVGIDPFGSALNLNIHFHMLFLDGVYSFDDGRTKFHRAPRPTATELAQLLHRGVHNKPTYFGRGASTQHVYYGPNRNRYKRIDDVSDPNEKETHYVGNIERIYSASQTVTKRYLDGEVIATRTEASSSITEEVAYLLKDHLGSTHMIVRQVSGGNSSYAPLAEHVQMTCFVHDLGGQEQLHLVEVVVDLTHPFHRHVAGHEFHLREARVHLAHGLFDVREPHPIGTVIADIGSRRARAGL